MASSLRQILQSDRVLVGATLMEFVRPSVVKIFKQAGYDFFYIEYEHALMDPMRLSEVILCAKDNAVPVVSKIPSLDRAWTTKLLDAGAEGIQLPYTETREQIDRLVELVKFPPIGKRPGCPGLGNTGYHGEIDASDLIRRGNEETVIIAHIESELGVNNIEEILDNPHVDVAFIGQYDLSISYGVPGQFEHPKHQAAIQRVIDAGRERGKVLGIAAGDYNSARKWIDQGARFIETQEETALLLSAAKDLVDEFRRHCDG
jgi:2-dehydro-3-deoxyglucarate aldolase/4-hydroxy-2-oxoheptanedioate aldolase